MDTDLALAVLSSLVPNADISQDVLLDALVAAHGDVEAAAKTLRLESKEETLRPGKRRRRDDAGGLDQWLMPPAKLGGSDSRRLLTDQANTSPPPVKPKVAVTSPAPLGVPTINDVLVDRSSAIPSVPIADRSLPPLTLGTAALVARHTPCTLIENVLPLELASRLYLTMIDESSSWQQNTWWLAERLVTSPHLTAFYVEPEASRSAQAREVASYWFYGRETNPDGHVRTMPEPLLEAREVIEPLVNSIMATRPREPLEWAGEWHANVAASNCYRGAAESVGAHADQVASSYWLIGFGLS